MRRGTPVSWRERGEITATEAGASARLLEQGAVANGWTFVTADEVLVRKRRHLASTSLLPAIRLLADAAADA